MRGLVFSVVVAASVALAQNQQPDEGWEGLPTSPGAQPPPPLPVPPAVLVAPAPAPVTTLMPDELRARLRAREEPNRVSMFGAPALGQWKRGQALALGFPFFQLRAAIGLLENLDVGLGFDSFYLLLNEVRLLVKYGFGKGPGFSVAASVEGGAAFFQQRASAETRGTRWITGRRNFNLSPGVIVSYQASSLRAARLFVEVRYLLAIDTEPFATRPLEGVPATVVLGHNVLTKFGAELPLSERTSFVFSLGLDGHLRPVDSPVMPNIAVGLVTGF